MGEAVIQVYRPVSIRRRIDAGTLERHGAPGRLGEPVVV